jgi:hypothetical protein
MKKLAHSTSAERRFALAPLVAALMIASGGALAGSVTYTLDNHFDQGTLQNVNHNAPDNDQLQLNITGTGFPVLWIANAGEHTLSKFDTTQQGASPGREVARYYTWFSSQGPSNNAWGGPAPSRTAVDIDGNAYVLNRHFEGRTPLLLKILANGFVDRNSNGTLDTSGDANNDGVIQSSEMKPLLDSNANSIVDDSEIQDERVAWAARIGPPNGLGRALCIGTDGHLWVGMYNNQTYYKVSSVDGSILAGPVSTAPTAGKPNAGAWTPYGCLIDKDGVLWSASLGNLLGKIENTASNTGPYPVSSFNGKSNYGIALGQDAIDGRTLVYLGYGGDSFTKFDSGTNSFSSPAAVWYSSLGVNTDGDGNILVSKSSGGVAKFAPNGSVIWDKPAQTGTATDSRGIMPDANSDIWQVHLGTSRISKFKGDDGAALGVLTTGNSPYTYSDASGFAAANITVSTGTWNVIQDSGAAGTPWGKVSWNANVPNGASVTARVRAADTVAGLQGQSFIDVTNGVDFNLLGQFIEAQVRLTANNQGDSPVVQDVTIASVTQGVCDVDGDGDIDKSDLSLISKARNKTPLPNDPRDADGDSRITPNDVKVCIPQCTRPNCAIQ